MGLTEQRSEPRYPIRAGFIEIDDRPFALDDLSISGLGFRVDDESVFSDGQIIKGFLVLQEMEEQYEMPVTLEVRRVIPGRVGCLMTCLIPHHGTVITSFLETKKAEGNKATGDAA